jgi:hypothetical protein
VRHQGAKGLDLHLGIGHIGCGGIAREGQSPFTRRLLTSLVSLQPN